MPGELSHTVSYHGKSLDSVEIRSICDSIQNSGVRLLSLRECELTDQGFKRLLKSVSRCKSILQLTLNVGIVTNKYRTEVLAQALQRNRSIRALFVHGNPIKDEGLKSIGKAVVKHPQLCSLDLGDCKLTDDSMETICDLMMSHGTKPGLAELCLSANPGITVRGWAKLSMVISKSRWLRSLLVDYNRLGDTAAGYLLIGLSANNSIEELDLEGTNISDFTAELILHWIQTQQVKLKKITLDKNRVDPSLIQSVYTALNIVDESVIMSEESGAEVDRDDIKDEPTEEEPANTTVIQATVHPIKPAMDCRTDDDNLAVDGNSDRNIEISEKTVLCNNTENEFIVPEKGISENSFSKSNEAADPDTPRQRKKMEEDLLLDEGIGTFPQAEDEVVEPVETFYQEEERVETFYDGGLPGDRIKDNESKTIQKQPDEEDKPEDKNNWNGDEMKELSVDV